MLPRTILLKVLALEALAGRVSSNHLKYPQILESLRLERAGYNGEKSMDYPLKLLDKEKYFIFNGLRLEGTDFALQLDTYLLSQYFSVIFESKNWNGQVCFKQKPCQVVRILDGIEQGMPNPVEQVKTQKYNLNRWYSQNQMPVLPLEGYGVFGNSTIITIDKGYYEAEKSICKIDYINSIIRKLETLYKTPILTQKELNKLKRRLLKANTPQLKNYLSTFNLHQSEVRTGVRCPDCGLLAMEYKKSSWHCPSCECISDDAHIPSIIDYYLIFGPMISHQDFKWFLHLHSSSVATKKLASLKFEKIGKTKSTIHKIPYEFISANQEKSKNGTLLAGKCGKV
ncbi:nuclease-related domain-containing protein [Neobacillus notoginsengisoli]|uniref:nuclease-related domain-containing protein n=1 Tax=Neobacillus notoginsengisoli TaxID=1578198 RepID=UPI0023D90291|nr:nuclease-related domain-containing protein [Neobacillus notoginsengisoli]